MTHDCSKALPPTLVADSGLDDADLLGLEMVRLMCVAYSGKQPGAWEYALERAEEAYGESDGAALFAAVRCLMAAIRAGRASCFDFMNPWCAECSLHVTGHELALLSLITASKQSDSPAAMAQAIVVCEGRPCGDLLESATRLAAVLRRIGQRVAEAGPFPVDGPGRLARVGPLA